MLRSSLIVAICLLVAAPGPLAGAKKKWELVTNSDGVKIYKRERADTPIIEFRGTAVVNVEPVKLMAVLLDYNNYTKWQPDLRASKIIKTVNNKQIHGTVNYLYFAINLPWPVTDRDALIRNRFIVDEKGKWFHVRWHEATLKSYPPKDDYVRAPLNRGKWSIRPMRGGKASWLEFSGYGDPGGMIPNWLVNWVSKTQIRNGIMRIKARIKKGQFNHELMKKFSFVNKWS